MRFSPETGADHGLYWLVSNLAADASLALLVDDAHWADAASLRFLLYLARRLRGLPVLVMLATRGDEPGADRRLLDLLAAEPAAERLAVGPLSAAGSAALMRARAGREFSAGVSAAGHEVSGGNPFFLCEIAAALPDTPAGGEAEAIGHVRSLVPAAVGHSILLRLGSAGPDGGAVAQALAVLGDGAPVELVSALSGVEHDATVGALQTLSDAGITARATAGTFTHPIIRSAVYAELSDVRRRALHGSAAELLSGRGAPSEELAHHLLQSEPQGDPDAVETLRAAAARAVARGAPAIAVPLLARALAEPPPADERAAVLAELGIAELAARAPADAAGHLRTALASDPPPTDRLAAALALSQALVASEGYVAAIEALRAAGEQLEGDEALRVQVEQAALSLYVPEEATAGRRRMRAYASFSGDTPTERVALAIASLAHGFDPAAHVSDALPLARRALAGGKLIAEQTSDAPPVGNACYVLLFAEELDDVEIEMRRCLADARARGSAFGFLTGSLGGAMSGVDRGALSSAVAHGEAALSVWPDVSHTIVAQRWVSTVVRCQTEALLTLGLARQARELVGVWSAVGDLNAPELVMIRYARGLLAQADGDHEPALADFLAYGEFIALVGYEDRTTRWRLGAARASAALGAHDEGVRLADEALALAETWGTPGGIGAALRVRALVGDPSESVERLETAVGSLRRSPYRLELASALVDLGFAERRAGRRAQAKAVLAEGLDLAAECGARPLVDRARGELTVVGARPRRDRITGRDALTPTERRIAELAAGGLINREIAQELFVTPKTVELHLSHVYRKLGVPGRAGLADELAGAPK